MPVYNAEKYLKESIESILNQTLIDFEFIIIDDFSTDNSWNIIKSYSRNDSRVKAFENKKKGCFSARNYGIQLASSDYIAVMDADDISYPNRLELQYDFLLQNIGFSLVCSGMTVIDDKSFPIEQVIPENDDLNFSIYLRNCIIHSSVMYRKQEISDIGLYNQDIDVAQDFDLWHRLLLNGRKFHIIEQPLIKYRCHDKNITSLRKNNQTSKAVKIISNTIEKLTSLRFKQELYNGIISRPVNIDQLKEIYKSIKIISKSDYFYAIKDIDLYALKLLIKVINNYYSKSKISKYFFIMQFFTIKDFYNLVKIKLNAK